VIGEPVRVRLDDSDSSPIVQTRVAAVLPKGTSGTSYQYKAKTNGLQKIVLKQKTSGMWQVQRIAGARRTPKAGSGGCPASASLFVIRCRNRTVASGDSHHSRSAVFTRR
jgi:hypothetical protein